MIKKILLGLALVGVVLVLQPGAAVADTTDFWGFKVNGWQRYPDPVLPRQSGQWDSALTREISPVILDTDGKLARGPGGQLAAYYYGAYNDGADQVRQIGRATSTDNGYTWTDRAVALAPSGVPGSWYESDVFQPTIIKRAADGELLMLAVGQQNNDYALATIGAFTSSDNGATWVDHGVQVTMDMFEYENGAPIEEFGVPRVIKRAGGDYLLVLEGQAYGSGAWRVFAATSPTFTGDWTAVNDGKPILLPGPAGWENIGVANPQIIEVAPSSYVMAYNGRGTAPPEAWQVGFASSTDLVNWYRHPGNPVLTPDGTGFDSNFVETSFLAKADSYGEAKLYYQGYDAASGPQVGVATADWREFSTLFVDQNGVVRARRLDGALLRHALSPSVHWQQIGADWNQFLSIFSSQAPSDDWVYAVRWDGALLKNRYNNGWQGWIQIGAGWDQFAKVFAGVDGWMYAIQSDGTFLRNKHENGNWLGWQQIGAGWDQFTQVFMGTDGWMYAVRTDGLLFKNKYLGGGNWQGWAHIGSDWSQFTQVFPGPDNWIYAKRWDGHLFKNKYVDGAGWLGWQEL